MPVLEIRHRSGRIETRELSKQSPLLIGRQSTCDIQVDADGVPPVQCRISWKQRNFEVAAVTPRGVQYNGATVQQSVLSAGDVLRVGDVDIVLLGDKPRVPAADSDLPPFRPREKVVPDDSDRLELKPVTAEELPVRSFWVSPAVAHHPDEEEPPSAESAEEEPAESSPARVGRDRLHDVVLGADELAADEASSSPGVEFSIPTRRAPQAGGILNTIKGAPKRPGEQDVLRSPLVIGLGVGSLALLLATATIWFVLSRERTQREYDTAKDLLDRGFYAQASEGFEAFVRSHPKHALASPARLAIAQSKVNHPLAGAVPAWDLALEALNAYISQYRDLPDFANSDSPERQFVSQSADKIAFGAAEAARTLRKRPLLAVSSEAVKLLELYAPADSRPEDRLKEIGSLARAAEVAVVQQEAFDVVAGELDQALKSQGGLAALPRYRKLLDRYPAAAEYKPLQDRVNKALADEQKRVTRDDSERESQPAERVANSRTVPVTLARRVRARSDVASVGATVFTTAEDCLYAVDSMTGEPLWRRTIGVEVPFPAIPVSVAVPGVLVFSTPPHELLLLHQRTGELIWRLPLEAPSLGRPLIHEGQVLLATANGLLEQIDLQTGVAKARLKFSQAVSGPPVVSASGQRLYLPGNSDVLYVLTRRPLACERVVWMGHGPGGIATAPLALRNYLLVAENDRTEQARLRVFDISREDQPPLQISEARVSGQIRNAPAVRGKQLAVPSSPEQVSAFTIAETGDQQALSFVASYQVKNPQGGAIHVAVGPDDQLWMASTALRRFTISRDSLLPDKQEAALGLTAQPLEIGGDSIFVARRALFSPGVMFAEVDRQRLATQWQTSLGATILAATVSATDGFAICVNNLGEIFQVSPQRLQRGGFELQSLSQIAVPEGLSESLGATRIADTRLAVWCGGADPRLWLVGGDGNPREFKLTHRLQSAPVSLGAGILLPLEGRLRLLPRGNENTSVEELPAPVVGTESPAWRAVAALDDTQALALNANGRLSRVQYRAAPVAHLAEVATWEAGQPVDVEMAVDQGRILLADASGRLTLLESETFEPLGQLPLDSPARQAPWLVGDRGLVESAGSKLICCDLLRKLAKVWELPLEAASVSGPPLSLGEQLLVALDDGRVLVLAADSGEVRQTHTLGTRLASGPERWGEQIVVATRDGSLVVLNPLLEGTSAGGNETP